MKHSTISAVTKALMDGRSNIEKGWVNHFPAGLEEKYCMITAIETKGMSREVRDEAWLLLGKHIPGTGLRYVEVFNDDPTTTKEMVLAVYDAAIEDSLA